jgi:PTH1 family peptidyl-tRNA hydrolase
MKLITGLGNPGDKYSNTRHNAGFLFVDRLREEFLYEKGLNVTEWRMEDTFQSEIAFLKKGSRIIAIFQKPQTFMNKSGEAVAKLVKKFEIDTSKDFILVHDDLDIPLGNFKIQEGKSPKGHNGVSSVEDRVGGVDFKRVRIGIENREVKNIPGEEYVIMNFLKEERETVDEVITEAVKSILSEILLYTS